MPPKLSQRSSRPLAGGEGVCCPLSKNPTRSRPCWPQVSALWAETTPTAVLTNRMLVHEMIKDDNRLQGAGNRLFLNRDENGNILST